MYKVERYHDISCGHRVYGHESKCNYLHGHNYRIRFVCSNETLDSLGRVIDFSVIKQKLCYWVENHYDHKFLVWEKDPYLETLIGLSPESIVVTPYNPTAENIAQYLVEHVAPIELKGTGVSLVECTVEETRKCFATYTKEGI